MANATGASGIQQVDVAVVGAGFAGLYLLYRLRRAGDGLRLEDGRIVAVEAAPERLLEITCADERALARVAWHLGNRHLAAEIGTREIHIREDHVIADMVLGLGAKVRSVERPFNPEGGAYGHGAVQGHDHVHHHDHRHHHHHHHHGDGGYDHHHHEGDRIDARDPYRSGDP